MTNQNVDHDYIYKHEAEAYDLLISKQPDLTHEINSIRSIDGLDIVDLGAGTGRLSTALATQAKSITAIDASSAMLAITEAKLRQASVMNWQTFVADHRHLPLDNNCADLVVSGWSIGYLASSSTSHWRKNLEKVMQEITRILRPKGTIILFETMGTCTSTPNPPAYLQPYFSALKTTYRFNERILRMDYEFEDREQAQHLIRFFFGDEYADWGLKHNCRIVPECAGMWWRQLNS